jgi:hypothetical protein
MKTALYVCIVLASVIASAPYGRIHIWIEGYKPSNNDVIVPQLEFVKSVLHIYEN